MIFQRTCPCALVVSSESLLSATRDLPPPVLLAVTVNTPHSGHVLAAAALSCVFLVPVVLPAEHTAGEEKTCAQESQRRHV